MTDTKRTDPAKAPGPDLEAARRTLQAAGYSVSEPGAGQDLASSDPFRDMDPDEIPQQVLDNVGISREELRRNREAPPAVEHGYEQAAASAPAPARAAGP